MTERVIYAANRNLWKGRTCTHDGCGAWAKGQCESFVGSAFDGNVCAKPLCTDHIFHLAGVLPVCRAHIKQLAAPVEVVKAGQLSLF